MRRFVLLLKKRKRIMMLLSAMFLGAMIIVFLIMHGPAVSGRETGDENTMRSSDDEAQVVWGDSAGDRRMPEFNIEDVKEYAYLYWPSVKNVHVCPKMS